MMLAASFSVFTDAFTKFKRSSIYSLMSIFIIDTCLCKIIFLNLLK